MGETRLPCRGGPCKYHGFWQLSEWCRHPDHTEPLADRRAVLQLDGGKCKSFIDWETKVMAGHEPPWPMPVDLGETFPRPRGRS